MSGVSGSSSSFTLPILAFTEAVDWRPWWHSRHRLAATAPRLPLSSFSVLKVTLFPLGKGTLTTGCRVNLVRSLWQVVQAKPLAG